MEPIDKATWADLNDSQQKAYRSLQLLRHKWQLSLSLLILVVRQKASLLDGSQAEPEASNDDSEVPEALGR